MGPCTLVEHKHAQITCTLPAGHGTGHALELTVGTGVATEQKVTWSKPIDYRRPEIHAAARVTDDGSSYPEAGGEAVQVVQTDTPGGDWLEIMGANFGAVGAPAGVRPVVTVGHACAGASEGGGAADAPVARPCTELEVLEANTKLRCRLPPGEGVDQWVTLTVSGQDVVPALRVVASAGAVLDGATYEVAVTPRASAGGGGAGGEGGDTPPATHATFTWSSANKSAVLGHSSAKYTLFR